MHLAWRHAMSLARYGIGEIVVDEDWKPESQYDRAMQAVEANPLMRWYRIRESVKNGPLGFVFDHGFDIVDLGHVGGPQMLGFEKTIPIDLVDALPEGLDATWEISSIGGGLEADAEEPVWLASVSIGGIPCSRVEEPRCLDEVLTMYDLLPLPKVSDMQDTRTFDSWDDVFETSSSSDSKP